MLIGLGAAVDAIVGATVVVMAAERLVAVAMRAASDLCMVGGWADEWAAG